MNETRTGEILALELSLLDTNKRHDRQWLEQVLAQGMVEFGKSGRVYDRDTIIEALLDETPAPGRFDLIEPTLTELSADTALLTYRLRPTAEAHGQTVGSLRSSIWRRRNGRWQLVFHQGTAAAPDKPR